MKRIEHQNRSCLLGFRIWFFFGVWDLGFGIFFSGCAVGPNYKPPHTSVAASFANAPTNVASTDEATLATWWKGFNDARLDGLLDRAIAHNHDLRIATANLKEARALRRLTTFDLAPTVQANAGYQNGLLSKPAAPPGASRGDREFELYDASFDATWELDLFGRVRRSVQAANAQLGSVEATQLDVLVSVTAEVARNYFELCGLQNQLAVARKNADVQTETLKITQSRLDGGRGTDFDVSRSRSLLNLTLSTIPPLEAAIQNTIYRISVLIGQQPAALTSELSAPEPLPAGMPSIALGDPATLLRRRPDIRAAERSLAAATARIGIATAELFPAAAITGRCGRQSATFAGFGKLGAVPCELTQPITW